MKDTQFLSINIRRLMDNANLSQKRLASLSGVSEHTIFRAVSKGVIPRGENLSKIAEALNVSASELFLDPTKIIGKEEKKPPELVSFASLSPDQLDQIKQSTRDAVKAIIAESKILPKDFQNYPPEKRQRLELLIDRLPEAELSGLIRYVSLRLSTLANKKKSSR